jgi:SNF2 family DNA or RNA helicase
MFVDQIEAIAARYSRLGATTIHGGVPTGPDDDMAFREARIRHFKTSPTCSILVANPAACGEGISLHKESHHAIYFDRSFNAAHFLQSIDRIHRRGLPEGTETRVDILYLEDSVEEAVRDRLSEKILKLQQLLDDEDLSAMVFDPEDVAEMGEDELTTTDLEAIMKSIQQ